jgi:hypothetical protein
MFGRNNIQNNSDKRSIKLNSFHSRQAFFFLYCRQFLIPYDKVLNNRKYYRTFTGRMNMKKYVLIITIAVLLCITSFSGCFEQNEQPKPFTTVDSDGDGLSDEQEGLLGTNMTNPDSDGDGIYDFFEIHNGTTIDTDSDGIIDALDADDDGDSVPTALEHPDDNHDGNPSDALDTDDDGTPDYLDTDDDNDGILTVVEQVYNATFGGDVDHDGLPNYRDSDSDGDGQNDGFEGTGDVDGDGIPNFLDANDNDGPLGDLDGDGVTKQEEGSMDPIPPDANGDGIPDYLDPETHNDSDGSSTEQERFFGSWVNKADSNEHWIFYENGTLKTVSLVTEDPVQEPYFIETWFNYTVSDSLLCLLVLDGYSTTPICYPYEFFDNDASVSLSYTGVVVLEFIRG